MTSAILVGMVLGQQQQQGLGALTSSEQVRVPFDASAWTLVWSDEFEEAGMPDPEKWVYEEGYIRNDEKQYYTKARKENCRVENGKLVIEARKDNFEGKPITSASITTEGKQSFLYGRIEARAKIPTGRGTWPAIWTLGENIREVGWPKCGELDILENVGYNPKSLHANVHTEAYNHTKQNGKGSAIQHEAPWEDYHIYAVEWYEDRVEFFFDETRYFVYNKPSDNVDEWPFAANHYLIINLAIGGAWGGQQGVDESLLPHRYEIDYVKYYKRK